MIPSPTTSIVHRILVNSFAKLLLLVTAVYPAGCHLVTMPQVNAAEEPAQTAARPAPRNVVIFSSERPMRDDQWTALFDAVRGAQKDTRTLSEFDLLRADQIKPGMPVGNVITVRLHGDCSLHPRPRYFVQGALGWVPRAEGHIQPYVHVDCGKLEDMLGPYVLGMNRDRRDALMAGAIAHVFLHEWIHISSQSAHHGGTGVMQSTFNVYDLVANELPRSGKRTRKAMPMPLL